MKVFCVKGSNINEENVEINDKNGKKVIKVTTDKDGDKDEVWVVVELEVKNFLEEALKSTSQHPLHRP
ncbi:MAG: hypothetical protein R2769_02785 [Saprospiraceae bacterium]